MKTVLTMPVVETEVHRLAAMIGASDRQLPTFGYSDDGARPHIEVDGSDYHFVVIDRGQQLQRVTTPDLDELLYHVFDSVTFGMSTTYASGHRRAGEEFRRPLFARQEQLLGTLSPGWAARKAAEHAKILQEHPFEDSFAPRPSAPVATVESPDHTFSIQTSGVPDERGFPMLSTRIISRETNAVLLDLDGYDAIGAIQHLSPHQADLTLRGRSNDLYHVQVDVQANQFHFMPAGKPRPLAELATALFELQPKQPPVPIRVTSGQRPKPLLGDLLMFLISAAFTAGGIWVAFEGKTSKDRSAGAAGFALFGMGAIVYGRSLSSRLTILRMQTHRAVEPGWAKLASYLPLIAAVAEIPWCIVCFLGLLFIVGDTQFVSTPGTVLLTKLIFPVPAVLGLIFGLMAMIAKLARTWARLSCLVTGMTGCGLIVAVDLLGYIR